MLFWLGLVAGLIVGWLIEWIIDWRFWRSDLNQSLEMERRWRAELEAARQEIAELRRQLAERTDPAADSLDAVVHRDPLGQIKGLGALQVRRLNAAGIFTFRQLAETSLARLQAIFEPEVGQGLDLTSWIAEANLFAQASQPNNPPRH